MEYSNIPIRSAPGEGSGYRRESNNNFSALPSIASKEQNRHEGVPSSSQNNMRNYASSYAPPINEVAQRYPTPANPGVMPRNGSAPALQRPGQLPLSPESMSGDLPTKPSYSQTPGNFPNPFQYPETSTVGQQVQTRRRYQPPLYTAAQYTAIEEWVYGFEFPGVSLKQLDLKQAPSSPPKSSNSRSARIPRQARLSATPSKSLISPPARRPNRARLSASEYAIRKSVLRNYHANLVAHAASIKTWCQRVQTVISGQASSSGYVEHFVGEANGEKSGLLYASLPGGQHIPEELNIETRDPFRWGRYSSNVVLPTMPTCPGDDVLRAGSPSGQ